MNRTSRRSLAVVATLALAMVSIPQGAAAQAESEGALVAQRARDRLRLRR